MKNDFTSVPERRGDYSLKWDIPDGQLPMWVADMDFATAPAILEAIVARAKRGVFGYTVIPDAWHKAYVDWWRTRHNTELQKDWLIFCTGIVPAISSMVRKLTTPNENVVIQTPVYNIFFNSIINNGCRVLESPLLYEDGHYNMDYGDLEAKLANPQTSLLILCNPHNPVGRIWNREELERVGELCAKHNVTVISDEIHCDLTEPGRKYVPFAKVSETCRKISVSCYAPTKAFNLAGLQTAAVSVPEPFLRHKVWRGLNTDEVAEPNAFAVDAAIAAFTKGASWLDELREVIASNKQAVYEACRELPIEAVKGEATYLVWIDCRKFCAEHGAIFGKQSGKQGGQDVCAVHGDKLSPQNLAEAICAKTGLLLCDGSEYGDAGSGFLRMNVACPRTVLDDGLSRLRRFFAEF